VVFSVITGEVAAKKRQAAVAAFQQRPACRVALLSIKASGAGLNLAAASECVFAELAWTPGELLQAEDRAHRIGQKGQVTVHYLLADGTLDDRMWGSVRRKLDVVGRSVGGSRVHGLGSWRTPEEEAAFEARRAAEAGASGGSGVGQRSVADLFNPAAGRPQPPQPPKPPQPLPAQPSSRHSNTLDETGQREHLSPPRLLAQPMDARAAAAPALLSQSPHFKRPADADADASDAEQPRAKLPRWPAEHPEPGGRRVSSGAGSTHTSAASDVQSQPCWYWVDGSGRETAYPPQTASELERAFLAMERGSHSAGPRDVAESVTLGGGRAADLLCMRQYVVLEPWRVRPIRRGTPG
jgi:hypothetical protein